MLSGILGRPDTCVDRSWSVIGAITLRGHFHAFGQQFAGGGVQLDLTGDHRIGQQDSGQDLGCRPELINRIAIRNSRIIATHPAISEDLLLSALQHADRHADDHVVVEIGLYQLVGALPQRGVIGARGRWRRALGW